MSRRLRASLSALLAVTAGLGFGGVGVAARVAVIPSAADVPSFTLARTQTPSTLNPLGVKGVGEAGTIASTPAVVNAIVDALRPFGVTDVAMPCTPERVWRAINNALPSPGETPPLQPPAQNQMDGGGAA